MIKRNIRIATRKSALALWQAEFLKKKLQNQYPQNHFEIIGLTTKGDQILDIPLHKTGGKGLFVKELEEALLNHSADIAVHSMKDIPAEIPNNLEIAVILEREDPRDAFLSKKVQRFLDLPQNASIGTSSLRRQAQLAAHRSDLHYEYLRGNVDTRIRKLDQDEFDAIILAVAGLKRLGLQSRITEILEPSFMLPCVGQGALGIECREDDSEIKEMLAPFHHIPTAVCIAAERSMNSRLGGSCQLPVAGLATLSKRGSELELFGKVGMPNGSRIIKVTAKGSSQNPEELGIKVAEQLLAAGAEDIIHACRS
jgi:hydroxymethylbilane synthase